MNNLEDSHKCEICDRPAKIKYGNNWFCCYLHAKSYSGELYYSESDNKSVRTVGTNVCKIDGTIDCKMIAQVIENMDNDCYEFVKSINDLGNHKSILVFKKCYDVKR